MNNLGKDNSELEDELLPEYDLKSLRVRKLGSGRKSFSAAIVRLETDAAKMFPSADSVNEALRLLMQIAQRQSANNPRLIIQNKELGSIIYFARAVSNNYC